MHVLPEIVIRLQAARDHGRRRVLPRHRHVKAIALGADLVGIGRVRAGALAAKAKKGVMRCWSF